MGGTMEGAWMKNSGSLLSLSEQQLADCVTQDYGCNGGDTPTAYQYMEKNGVELEKDYPYRSGTTGWTGRCHYNAKDAEVKVTGFSTISSNADQEPRMYDEILKSPMSICVDAESWQTYQGGVVTSATCGAELDHCVQVVGINADEQYWTVRNSWNTDWGEDGFIRVHTGQNACGIAMEATVPTAENEQMEQGLFI